MTNHLLELHTAAMDLMDDAELAKKKGDVIAANKYWEKAWTLERSYALAIPTTPEFQLTRSILFRSAAWLAIKSGKYQEAIDFTKKILAENPHPDIITQLREVLAEATQCQRAKKVHTFELTGKLISADIPFNQIKIQEEQSKTIYVFWVSAKSIGDMVKSFWEERVIVNGKSRKDGIIHLDNIRKAV